MTPTFSFDWNKEVLDLKHVFLGLKVGRDRVGMRWRKTLSD